MAHTTDLHVSGFMVLKCEYFYQPEHVAELKYPELCCKACHADTTLIVVRPRDFNKLTDWFLGIEAAVCCKLYDLVRALPHQWWIDRALEHGTTRVDVRKDVASYESGTVRRSSGPPSLQTIDKRREAAKQYVKSARKQEEDGGIEGFLRGR